MTISTLRKLNSVIKQYEFITFDIETVQNERRENEFYIGTTYDGNTTQVFTDKEEMIVYLLQQRRKTLIVASNLEFDFEVLFADSDYYTKFKPIRTKSSLIAELYHLDCRNGTIKFLDSYNYLRATVEQYGKILKLPKLDKPTYLGKLPRRNVKAQVYTNEGIKTLEDTEYDYLVTYCSRDSEITYEFMQFIQKGFNEIGAELKLTIASTSMDLFRRKYMTVPILSEDRKFDNINNKIFKAYYGARTEIFKRGIVKNHKYLDYNSMYPSVMMNEYPNPNSVKYVNDPSRLVLEYKGVARVNMECPKDMHIPLLPLRTDKLIFPTGDIRGTYTHDEINKAIELGYTLKKIFWSTYYTKGFYPFREYITSMYHKRKELKAQGSQMEIVYKLFMNSLYGKFGQRHMSDIEFFNMEKEEQHDLIKKYPQGKVTTNPTFTRGYIQNDTECKSSFVRPIFPTYVTAYARMKIHEDIIKYDAVYCDTDSIITRKEIPDSKELGGLKIEADIRRGIFARPKMYTFTTTEGVTITKLKGVPRADIKTFESILRGKNVEYQKFTKTKESLKRGIKTNTVEMMNKHIKLEDNKRLWSMNFDPTHFDEYSKPHCVDSRGQIGNS